MKIVMNKEAIVAEIAKDLETRLQRGIDEHGPTWDESPDERDVLEDIREELMDALVYIWVIRQQQKQLAGSLNLLANRPHLICTCDTFTGRGLICEKCGGLEI